MNKEIVDIYNLIQEISWHFGSQGFNGECCGDLSLVEFMALKKIYEKEYIAIQEVGNALGFTKSGASKIIDRIEDKGYVVRKVSKEDGRVCCVTVTEKGSEVMNNIVTKYSVYVENMLKELDAEAVNNIKQVLEKLVSSIQKQSKA